MDDFPFPDSCWDSRSNTLTFQTFRPASPCDWAAVHGVTRAMLNGTASTGRQAKTGNQRVATIRKRSGAENSAVNGSCQPCPTTMAPKPENFRNTSHNACPSTMAPKAPPRGIETVPYANVRLCAPHNVRHIPYQQPAPIPTSQIPNNNGNMAHDASNIFGIPKVLNNCQDLLIEIALAPHEYVLGFSMASKNVNGNVNEVIMTKVYQVIAGMGDIS